jgi:hypothetical protein
LPLPERGGIEVAPSAAAAATATTTTSASAPRLRSNVRACEADEGRDGGQTQELFDFIHSFPIVHDGCLRPWFITLVIPVSRFETKVKQVPCHPPATFSSFIYW